jgi:hypothetical protein
MSADNWTTCPRCFRRARLAADEARAAVMASYGKVPLEEFDAARAALEEPDPDTYTTFREDYEFFGADKGVITASYKGACTTCGLSVSFKHEKTFWCENDQDTGSGS